MRFDNFLILIGRTFISTFFLVNIFNIIPLDFSRNSWSIKVSMLFVDTASLFLLGLCALKICAFMILKSNMDENNNLTKTQTNNIELIDKFSRYGMYFFLFLAIIQIFIFFNGIKQVNSQYMFQYDRIEQSYEIKKEEISLKFKDNDQSLFKDNLDKQTSSLDSKKNRFIKDLNKANSTAKFLLIQGNVKVFLKSLVWTYGLFKLSSFKYDT